jgi:hypothetical protein
VDLHLINGVKEMSNKAILPYDLRVAIWDLIHQGQTHEEILKMFYCDAPPGVSEEQFKRCVRAINGVHTKGQRPRDDC